MDNSYQLLGQPIGKFMNSGFSNIIEQTTYPLYQKQETYGGKKKERRDNTREAIRKYEKKILNQKKLAVKYPTIYNDPFLKMAQQTNGTLTGRGRPKKIKADAPIEDILNLYEKKEGVIDNKKDNKKDKKHLKDMKKLSNDLVKYHKSLSNLIEKHKSTLEGAGMNYSGGNIFDWIANKMPDIVGMIPEIGFIMKPIVSGVLDLLDSSRKNPQNPKSPESIQPPERQFGEREAIKAPSSNYKQQVGVRGNGRGTGGRIRKRQL